MTSVRSAAPVLLALGLLLAPPPADAAAQSPTYDEMVARLVAGDSAVDFTALRLAYTETDGYAPYSGRDLQREMLVAFRDGDHALARTLADSILRSNFVSFDAHYVAMVAAEELGDTAAADFHERVARGLMSSIASKDGRSPGKPMVVISVAEEYAYLRTHGLQPVSQTLGECAGGAHCDVLEVRDVRTGETFNLYFDVSILRERMLAGLSDK